MKRIRIYAVVVLTVSAVCLNLRAQEREVPLVAGTLLQCTLNEPDLSSRTAKPGEPLVCYARPLNEFGCAAFPRGTELAGRFVDSKEPGRFFGKGWIQLEFDRLIFFDGEAPIAAKVISVHGFKVDSDGKIMGRGHAKRDAVGWAIPFLWPIKVATLPLRGPRPSLKGERVISLRLLEDVQVPCRGFESSFLRPGWHHFGPSSLNRQQSPSAGSAHDATRQLSTGRRPEESVTADREQRASNNNRPLVIESGHHKLFIGSSSPSPVAAPNSEPN